MIKNLVVLIADSKPYSRTLLRTMLGQLDIKSIHEAADGAGALDVIALLNPDVMIVDWELPGLSARDLLRVVRTQGVAPNPDMPIIVVSNSGQSEHVHEAIKQGAQHFMVRPISPKMLAQRLAGLSRGGRRFTYKAG